MKTPSVRGDAIILELKVTDKFHDMEHCCNRALQQIEENNYDAMLQEEGYSQIRKYGVCFYKKECLVISAE